MKLQKLLEKEKHKVTINPNYPAKRGAPGVRPRKGCFEVRVVGGEVVLSIIQKRPFPKLKALNIEEVCSKTIKALANIKHD